MPENDWVVIDGGQDSDEEVPREVVETLYAIQDAILRHPMVVQAAFSALVAEGRRFAQTPEGAALRERLVRSRSSASARMIWELLTTNAFEEHPTQALPSAFVERLVQSLAIRGIEPLISRLFERRSP